jgi:hypothetical protein|tara:strand:- start:436 stop:585 length:150 start_codon:yes stop_codon:yes gene_type:complete
MIIKLKPFQAMMTASLQLSSCKGSNGANHHQRRTLALSRKVHFPKRQEY